MKHPLGALIIDPENTVSFFSIELQKYTKSLRLYSMLWDISFMRNPDQAASCMQCVKRPLDQDMSRKHIDATKYLLSFSACITQNNTKMNKVKFFSGEKYTVSEYKNGVQQVR